MSNAIDGFKLLVTGAPLFWMCLGVVAGFAIGVLPGFSGSNATALALPFSIALRPESALILMASIYAGSAFGGSLPGILMNVPGTPESAAATLEGYPMAQKGRARLAIGVSRMASVIGGTLSAITVLLVIGPMSDLSLKFGARELFVVSILGIVVIGTLLGKSKAKGLLAAALGLLIAAMSASPLTAEPRFTLGFLQLYDEVPFVPAVIGLFALTQMFDLARKRSLAEDSVSLAPRSSGETWRTRFAGSRAEIWEGVRTTISYPWVLVRSTVIGLIVGIIPGTGTTVGNFVAYGDAKRRSKNPQLWGKGNPEGIIAAEACDNAVTSATLVPTLTLGIPGSGTAAVMLAALYLHGIQPGPEVMTSHAPEVYSVLFSMLLASLLILPFGILFAMPLVKITKIPPGVLVPVVLLLSSVGTYAIRNSLFDVGLAFVFGLLGLLMRQYGYPVVPLIMGLILGPLVEQNLLLSLKLGGDSVGYFFGSPTALVMWTLLVALIGYVVLSEVRGRATRGEDSRSAEDTALGVGR